jgi:predicted CXXCH cytochrome family protein
MFHDKGITVVRDCQDCHVNRTKAQDFNLTIINTHYPGAPDGKANTQKKNNYTCRVCHNATNNSMHSSLEVRKYDNETFGYCFQCHGVEGKFPYKPQAQIGLLKHGSGEKVISGCESCHSAEGISKFHTATLIGKSYFSDTGNYKTECTSCHEKHKEREYQPFENIQCTDCHTEYGANHYANAQLQNVDQNEACKICHNKEAEVFHNLTHAAANVSQAAYEPCRACHADLKFIQGEQNRSTTILKGTMLFITSNNTGGSNITCTSCHNATGSSQFHYDNYPLGAVQNPGWQNWSAGNVTGCKDCHTYFGGEPPFNATNMGTQGRSPAGSAHGYAPNCTLCHGGSDPIRFHSLAATEFIPRTGIMLVPETVKKGDESLLHVQVVLPPLMKVTRAEYFIDELGRQGYGLQLNYIQGESGGSSALLGAIIDTNELSYGVHPIFVRVKDSAGKWSKPDIAVLTVIKPGSFEVAETLLKYVIPVIMIVAIFIFLWRRFR